MASSRPLFPGTSDHDQLMRIFKVLLTLTLTPTLTLTLALTPTLTLT